MRKGMLILAYVLIIVTLIGCGEKQGSLSDKNEQDKIQQSNEPAIDENNETKSTVVGKTPPVIDHLDTYPFLVPSGQKEEKFEVREYEEGMDWEAVFAGITYHGTFTFGLGDEYSEWGNGQGYVEIMFSEKQ